MLIDAFGAPPDQALTDLASGAAGNPSLLTELIRGLGDDNAVRVSGGRAVLVSASCRGGCTGSRSGGLMDSASRPGTCW